MARTRIFVDIRKHRGDSGFAVELVRCFSSRFTGAALDWLVRPNQAHLIPPEPVLGTADEFDKSWGPRLRDRLVQSAHEDQDATGGAFLVLSYDNFLLNEVKTANTSSIPLTAIHISDLFKMGVHRDARIKQIRPSALSQAHPQSLRTGWAGPRSTERSLFLNFNPKPSGSPLSLAEAEQLAKKVLRNGGYFSSEIALPQKDLRPRMAALDLRAARQFGDPASETLITTLVDSGLQEGWLRRFRRLPGRTGTEMLYLIENARSTATLPITSTESHLPVEIPHRAATTSASPNTELPASLETSDHCAAVPADAGDKRKKHPNRATDFEAILSKSRIGAMPESRERALEAVAAIITENQGPALPLLELFRRAITRAKEASEREGYSVERNWPVVQLCMKRLMLWAGVLLDQEGQPITDKIGSNAKEVSTLADDFRRLCEAFLVEHLIEKSGGINYDDETYYIGLTIYRRGIERAVSADELKAKADSILAFLEDNGRIYLDSNRMLRAKSPKTRTLAVAAG
jgi:hypothetical protein